MSLPNSCQFSQKKISLFAIFTLYILRTIRERAGMRLLRVAAHCAGRRSRRGCERKKGTRWRDRMYKQYSRLCRLRQRRASMHHNCDRHAQGCREASTARRSPARRSLHQLRWASAARQARVWDLTARGVTGAAGLWASAGSQCGAGGRMAEGGSFLIGTAARRYLVDGPSRSEERFGRPASFAAVWSGGRAPLHWVVVVVLS